MRPPAKKPAGESAPVMAPGTDPLARGGILDLPPADPVTALRIVGEEPELPLPLSDDKRSFTLGSAERPAVDLSLRHCPHVSGVHVVIHRRGNRLWIVDQESTNGTFFGERREKAGEIAAGGKFRVADKELLALDDGMRV